MGVRVNTTATFFLMILTHYIFYDLLAINTVCFKDHFLAKVRILT